MITSTLKAKQNITSNRTLDPIVSPITAQQLADYLALDYVPEMESVLDAHLLAACTFYINYTGNELLKRDYIYKLDRWPEYGSSVSGLSMIGAQLKYWLTVPVYPVDELTALTIGGDNYLDKSIVDSSSKPARVFIQSQAMTYGEIILNYTAGYETAADIPSNTILGLYMLAGYLYEHRGACAMDDAIKVSGAKVFFDQSRMLFTL